MRCSNLEKKRVMTQQPKVPHFNRVIIHSDHLLEGKLPIPRRFMRDYGSVLSESVVLKVPSGMTWKVELIKSGDELLFGKGWDKFVQRNGIGYGYLIVFQYQGSCNFRVVIFDLSATEIAYPCKSVNNEEEVANPEVVGEFPRSLKKKHSVEKRCIRPQKRKSNAGMKNIKEEEKDVDPEVVDEPPRNLKKNRRVPTPCITPENRMKIKADVGQKLPTAEAQDQEVEERKKTLKKKDKENALSRARAAFKSANQSFMVVLQPAYIQRCYLPIPFSFHKYLHEKQCVRATLSSLSGRTWPIRFHHKKIYTRITSGWNEFVKDNVLEVGDVCAFELIEGTTTSFKVVFFRAAEDARLS